MVKPGVLGMDGAAAGSANSMIAGCHRLSNCAARIMYMNASDNRKAITNSAPICRAKRTGTGDTSPPSTYS